MATYRPRAKWTLVLASAVVLAGLVLLLRPPAQIPDDQQITQVLSDAARAAESHSVKGIMAHVSGDYRDAIGLDRGRLQLLISRGLSSMDSLRVDVATPQVILKGDRATAETTVTISGSLKDAGPLSPRTHALRFYLAREPAKRLLVLPSSVWRVTGVEGFQAFLDFEDLFR
ncbi:MAG TPA: hypothetical protein VGN26_01975 [Armatimonadota bacterium]